MANAAVDCVADHGEPGGPGDLGQPFLVAPALRDVAATSDHRRLVPEPLGLVALPGAVAEADVDVDRRVRWASAQMVEKMRISMPG